MMARYMMCLVVALSACCALSAQDRKPASPDETVIRNNVQAYVQAFNKKDAKTIAAFWTPEGVYLSRSTGEQAVGPAEIEKELAADFARNKTAKLEVDVESVDFLSPGVALERGTARMTGDNAPEGAVSYSAVHVKRNGKWLIDRITEDQLIVRPSAYERLQPLEWMVGSWENQEDDGTNVKVTCEWAKNQNFLVRSFVVAIPGQDELSGVQIIGWDPVAGKIRSWVFDSDGGFGEALWTKKGEQWTINAAGTLADGRRASSINTIKMDGKDSFRWQVTGREVDGEILPNLPEIKVKRKS